jgi:formate dehydrogenase accessory protein FdhD
MSHPPSQRFMTQRIDAGCIGQQQEWLAAETAIALVYNGLSHAVMMATPADLEDFALGFTVTEGIVATLAEVSVVDITETVHGISVQMRIPQKNFDALEDRSRNLTGRTGCGLCGAGTLAAAIRPVRHVDLRLAVDPAAIFSGFAALAQRQPINDTTGALHAAAVIAGDGQLIAREDVGRHNAIDKAIGATLRAGLMPRSLLVTSRASYEVVHKAAQVGCALVAAISAPTALAVRLAEEAGITLVGFAREPRLTVYAGVGGGEWDCLS